MIALLDEFLSVGSVADDSAPEEAQPGLVVAVVTVPPEAVSALRALVGMSHTVARLERITLNAITKGKSPGRVVPLLEKHAELLRRQVDLVHRVATLLRDANVAVFGESAD